MEATRVDGRLHGELAILRDSHGVPHVFADTESDAYFGLGVCMAQDRPRQLDWLRRKAAGRLAETLGARHLERDVEARTIGFRAVALATLDVISPAASDVLSSFADGVTAGLSLRGLRTAAPDGTGSPDAWSPVDTLAVFRAFAWQLSGRLHHILAAELAHQRLPAADAERFLSAYDGGSSIS